MITLNCIPVPSLELVADGAAQPEESIYILLLDGLASLSPDWTDGGW